VVSGEGKEAGSKGRRKDGKEGGGPKGAGAKHREDVSLATERSSSSGELFA